MTEITTFDELLDAIVSGKMTEDEAAEWIKSKPGRDRSLLSYETYGANNTTDHNEALWALQERFEQPKKRLDFVGSDYYRHDSGKPGYDPELDDEDAI